MGRGLTIASMVHMLVESGERRGARSGTFRIAAGAEIDHAIAELVELAPIGDEGRLPSLGVTTAELPGGPGMPASRWTVVVVGADMTAVEAASIVSATNDPRSAVGHLRSTGAFVALRCSDAGYAIALYLPPRVAASS